MSGVIQQTLGTTVMSEIAMNVIKVRFFNHSVTSYNIMITSHNTSQAVPHRLQNLKWPLGGPNKMVDGVWSFGRNRSLLQNKVFDLSSPSIRKVDDREPKRKG